MVTSDFGVRFSCCSATPIACGKGIRGFTRSLPWAPFVEHVSQTNCFCGSVKLSKQTFDVILDGGDPAGCVLSNPTSKLIRSALEALWDHWTRRAFGEKHLHFCLRPAHVALSTPSLLCLLRRRGRCHPSRVWPGRPNAASSRQIVCLGLFEAVVEA